MTEELKMCIDLYNTTTNIMFLVSDVVQNSALEDTTSYSLSVWL